MAIEAGEFASSEDIESKVLKLIELLSQSGIDPIVVVVGSSVLKLAFGDAARTPKDIDLAVSKEVLDFLKEQPGWEKSYFPDGRVELRSKDGFHIGVGWGKEFSIKELRQMAWSTSKGVLFADPFDVFRWKLERSNNGQDSYDKDLQDLTLIEGDLLRRLPRL